MGLEITVVFVCDKCGKKETYMSPETEQGVLYEEYYFTPLNIKDWRGGYIGLGDMMLLCPECVKTFEGDLSTS